MGEGCGRNDFHHQCRCALDVCAPDLTRIADHQQIGLNHVGFRQLHIKRRRKRPATLSLEAGGELTRQVHGYILVSTARARRHGVRFATDQFPTFLCRPFLIIRPRIECWQSLGWFAHESPQLHASHNPMVLMPANISRVQNQRQCRLAPGAQITPWASRQRSL